MTECVYKYMWLVQCRSIDFEKYIAFVEITVINICAGKDVAG